MNAAARHAERERPVVAFHILVRIPITTGKAVVVAAPDLHEPHAALQEAPRGEALPRKMPGLFRRVDLLRPRLRATFEPVKAKDVRRLRREIKRLGRGELHARGEFVAADAGIKPLVALARGGVPAVQFRQQSVRVSLAGGRHVIARGMRPQVGDGRVGIGVDERAAVLAGQEGGVPVLHAVRGEAPVIRHHDERRQVIVQRAETVAHPAARAGKAGQLEARGLEQRRGAVHA